MRLDELDDLNHPLLIDVRSPREYEEDHLPGSWNLPVLSSEERDRVGTIYHQESQFEARKVGAKHISENLPGIIESLDDIADENRPIVVYCWRGGNRSRSLAHVLDKIGYNVHRLEGGYKSYRSRVNDFLRQEDFNFVPVTIFGDTGAGKTQLLDLLARRGQTTLDLERSANHRGSAFGGVGLRPQPSQKTFESRLYSQLNSVRGTVFVEGESRKIGRRVIPPALFDRITDPPRIWLQTSLPLRVKRITESYPWEDSLGLLIDQLDNLKERLGSKTVETLQNQLGDGKVQSVVKSLLTEYYDPAYKKSCPDRSDFELVVDGDDLGKAADRIVNQSGIGMDQ